MKYQRLEDLRTDHDLTIRQVADYLGCNRDVYTRYEKGVRQLPISIAIRLAELYQVSFRNGQCECAYLPVSVVSLDRCSACPVEPRVIVENDLDFSALYKVSKV